MFSISHSDDGGFRLEIHADPSELDPESARRLRRVLLGLARKVPGTDRSVGHGNPHPERDAPSSRAEQDRREG